MDGRDRGFAELGLILEAYTAQGPWLSEKEEAEKVVESQAWDHASVVPFGGDTRRGGNSAAKEKR